MKTHHVGYLVDDINEALSEFALLGLTEHSETAEDTTRQILVVFIDTDGTKIELVQPSNTSSPFYGLRKKYRNCPYHLCFITSDIEKKIAELTGHFGWQLIQKPAPAPAIPGTPDVAFLINHNIGIIELLEQAND